MWDNNKSSYNNRHIRVWAENQMKYDLEVKEEIIPVKPAGVREGEGNNAAGGILRGVARLCAQEGRETKTESSRQLGASPCQAGF